MSEVIAEGHIELPDADDEWYGPKIPVEGLRKWLSRETLEKIMADAGAKPSVSGPRNDD